VLLLAATVAGAQEFPEQSGEVLTGPQKVAGKVVRPGADDMIPVPGVWVTLHRVGADASGPLDSARADGRGQYSFDFVRTGDESAIYFVSASYSGIAYFTPPFHHSVTMGEEAEIAVFDTTSAPVPMSVRGHHIIVSAVSPNATRSVTEVFEIANDSSVTRVVGAGQAGRGGAVWSTPLPAKATSFQVSHGDVPAGAIRFETGSAHVLAPIAPGLKQIAFTYSIPAAAFPLRLPVTRPTQVLEVLIEEENGSVTGALLREVDPVSLEQRRFRRFLAADVPADEMSLIDLPSAGLGRGTNRTFLFALTAAIAGVMAFVLARALRRQ
jgi:hypothetical protein